MKLAQITNVFYFFLNYMKKCQKTVKKCPKKVWFFVLRLLMTPVTSMLNFKILPQSAVYGLF